MDEPIRIRIDVDADRDYPQCYREAMEALNTGKAATVFIGLADGRVQVMSKESFGALSPGTEIASPGAIGFGFDRLDRMLALLTEPPREEHHEHLRYRKGRR